MQQPGFAQTSNTLSPRRSFGGGSFIAKFLEAQNQVYPQVLGELRAGQKRSHWMWFVFPQIAGLGRTATARHFAIDSLDQAEAYLAHPILATRLRECTQAVLLHGPGGVAPRSLSQIFGYPDDLKFHSSMTLFHRADPDDEVFIRALRAFFRSREDQATVDLL
ncbi:MAG: DUF1810 domain-containing protein [Candidatus Devosia phytovorans]|uniref:DUF1810 domain-containing protein n=1 Tax=Candidatus Devosia phytovorans TaxID=3121372 RepID=A0AAJ5VS50_9HYPH|nr:DUF1810 domain-containing protein [Devosia sp.]WEK03808.1 MAG: DUF1810 domain-containing protein [Devosia sp.]